MHCALGEIRPRHLLILDSTMQYYRVHLQDIARVYGVLQL